ncbi:MAG: hypothetical protein OR996_06090 [Phycisphaerales bacterium]|nr:hypothetical protein [Phycisphaerales bacterium]
MDRDRLKDIQTADISESNVNEDFVHWLKTKGPNYLLIIMIVIAGMLWWQNYQRGEDQYQAEAWSAYAEAASTGLPASLEDVAQVHADVDALQELGLLSAADLYLKAVINNNTVGNNEATTTILTADERSFYLDKADALYAELIKNDDNSDSITLFVVSGMFGRAAVAESKGDTENAKHYYELILARASDVFPGLSTQAKYRIETLDTLTDAIVLPTDAEVTARNNQVEQRDPTPVNSTIDALKDLSDSNE